MEKTIKVTQAPTEFVGETVGFYLNPEFFDVREDTLYMRGVRIEGPPPMFSEEFRDWLEMMGVSEMRGGERLAEIVRKEQLLQILADRLG